MQLTDDFTVPVDIERLWEVLNDVERIAPCVPGFTLVEASHPRYNGRMKVKVGAITVQYDATITFEERDEERKRVVLSVRGKELRGAGSVDATVTASLTAEGAATTAQMVTDVQVTGRVAQFGRGIIADVSSRMTEQFVGKLNDELLGSAEPVSPRAEHNGVAGSASEVSEPDAAPAETDPLDLGAVALIPVLKRLAPVVGALVLAAALARLLRSR